VRDGYEEQPEPFTGKEIMTRNHDGGGLEEEMVSPSRFTGHRAASSPVNGYEQPWSGGGSRAMIKKAMVAVCICLCTVNLVSAVHESTFEEARSLVEKAVTFLKANGKEKALAEFNKRHGTFVKGDLYVFVYDLNGRLLAHPVNPELVGKDLLNEPDSKGKLFRRNVVDLAKTVGSGWVDYTYVHPVTKKEEQKTTYFQRQGDLILCCGAYAVPPPLFGG
jgi:cytochrome c